MQGNGAGVAVFVNGKVLGGDFGYTYIGSYSLQNNNMKATVHVANFLPNISTVLGFVGDFDVEINAPLGDGLLQGAMSVIGKPGMSVAVRLSKKSNL